MPRCYKNIVPVKEVRTLLLYYKTDILMILTAKYIVNASAKMSAFGNEE